MRIAIIGAGPAGLYAAYLLRRSGLQLTVEVFEQNSPDATFGFGVVFSDRALDFLKADDEETYESLIPHMEVWQDLTIQHRGEVMPIDGVGFTAIGRLELLQLFQERAREVGIEPIYGKCLERLELLNDFDLVIGADGVNSLVRNELRKIFEASEVYASNRFIWYGTPQPFKTLTQTFIA
ncbi:MAG: FAD-dependent monooxygenase, partial [Sphingomonadales bacterium]